MKIKTMTASADFEEFLKLLNKNKVKYLIVGGYAYAIHFKPRYTNDIDIFILAETQNAAKVLKTLKDFGFGELTISKKDLTKPDQVIQLGYPPLRIDLLTSISGVEFRNAWKNKVKSKYGKQCVYFIGKKEFILNKKSSGRKKDLADLE
ncbi:MAG: nucleotidyltransferase [Bacteroidota bacterium]|nr:nucleotidyltransferase [Bacteroidota bacterium]